MTVVNTVLPVVSGTGQVGHVLQSTTGSWTFDDDYLTYTYQWRRCDAVGASCVDITGATSSSYTLVTADVGSTIRCKVSAIEHVSPLPPSSSTSLGYLRLGNLSLQSHPSDYGVRILSRQDTTAKPDPTHLYVHPWQVNQSDDRNGISYATAHANGWTLHNSSGGEIYLSAFGSYLADVGNAAYRTAWKNSVISKCSTWDYSGVFMDDVLTYNNNNAPSYSTTYPTNAAIKAAQLAWQVYMEPILHTAGLSIMVNANAQGEPGGVDNNLSKTNAWWAQLAPYVDYLLLEYWMNSAQNCAPNPDPDCVRRSGTTAWYNMWENCLALMDVAYNGGAAPVGVTFGTSRRRQGYCGASFLLGWDNTKGGGYCWAPNPPYTSTTDPWNSISAEIFALGNPTGAYTKVGDLYTRNFVGGQVKVNPVTGTWQIGALTS